MTLTTWLIIAFLLLGCVALGGYFLRLQRKSRKVAKALDYSKMRDWKEED